MDYSPYRKKATSSSSSLALGKFLPLFIFIGCSILGFVLFWAVKSWFFDDTGSSTIATFQAYEATAEVQEDGASAWTSLGSGDIVQQGERIRTIMGIGGTLYLKNTSTLIFGDNSSILIEEMKETEEGNLFGDIHLEQGEFLYTAKKGIDIDEGLKLWVQDNVYVQGNSGNFFVQEGGVHYISGEEVKLVQVDEKGKIARQQSIGVGQSLRVDSFDVEVTPSTVRAESVVIKALGDAGSIDTAFPTSSDLDKPEVLSPKSGYIVEEKSQKIRGIASLAAEKILIVYENGDNTASLSFIPTLSDDGEGKEWDYTVSESFDTLTKGINNYSIYAVDLAGNRSAPVNFILKYKTGDTNDDEDSASEDEDEDGNDDTGDRILKITSPNGGSNGDISTNIVTIKGIAPTDAAYIRITNQTTSTPSYTLQKFSKGDATWTYFTSPMPAKKYSYLVEALNSSEKVIATDTISITIPESAVPSSTSTTSPKASPSNTASPLPSNSVSKSPTPTPAPQSFTPNSTETPAIQTSTLEVSR